MSGTVHGCTTAQALEVCWHEHAACGGSNALLPVACAEADDAEHGDERLEHLLRQPLASKVDGHSCRVLHKAQAHGAVLARVPPSRQAQPRR